MKRSSPIPAIGIPIRAVTISHILWSLIISSFHRTSAVRVKTPSAGFCTFSALLEIRISSLLFSKTTQKPTLRAATIFRSAGRAILTILLPAHPLRGRLAARSRAAVAASIRPINFIFQRQRCGALTRPRGDVPTTAWFGLYFNSFCSIIRVSF